MRRYWSFTGIVGVAVALSFGAASTAGAQADTARREPPRPRVRIAKETPAPATVPAPAEPIPQPAAVVPAPRDTATVAVAVPPAEAATAVQPPQRISRSVFRNSGFYVGVGAGMMVPYGRFDDLGYNPGPQIMVPIGWHPEGQALGLRGTLSFNRAQIDDAQAARTSKRPQVYEASLDAVLKVPLEFARVGDAALSLYALGGGGLYHFRGLDGSNLARALSGATGERRATKWGVNAGGGAEWGVGAVGVFAEARYVNVYTGDSKAALNNVRWVPITLGFRLR